MDTPMNNPIVQSVIDLMLETGKSSLSGVIGKIRLYFIGRTLKCRITKEILRQYGNEPYYNDLDHFLQNKDVIGSIIRNCTDTSVFQHKSRAELVTYYVHLFIEQNPNYRKYHYKVRVILQKYFEIIYLALNKSKNEETRIICNVAKELSHGLQYELEQTNTQLKLFNERMERLVPDLEDSPSHLSLEAYVEYLLRLSPKYSSESYLKRNIYPVDDQDSAMDSLSVVLQEKCVLILGEAGFGKTYESVTLLHKACRNVREYGLIPLFFPLQEYGLLYPDIISGTKNKLAPYCDGQIDKLIQQDLDAGRYLFIFDGIDDIVNDDTRTKFYTEFNSFAAQHSNNYFFLTSRFNRYYGEISGAKEYGLSVLSEQVIRNELRREDIYIDIPQQYYSLFSNPLFLAIGKSVLNQRSRYQFFNRSKLFEALFQKLYGGTNRIVKYAEKYPLTYTEALNTLGAFAYQTFDQPSYSYMEFEEKLAKLIHQNKSSTIGYFIGSGIFNIEDRIVFIHKLFKEYCVAYYLVKNFPLSTNKEMYTDLVKKDEWKEVFIFASGIILDRATQDEFLDFVMSQDLPLYVECVNAKSDINQVDTSDNGKRLLTQILSTYRFILSNYFTPIQHKFDPIPPSFMPPKRKIGIIGNLSPDKSYLSYWFDFVPVDEDDVQCINNQQYKEQREAAQKGALQVRRNFCSHYVNLQFAGLSVESGRKIAIDLITDRLNQLIDSKKLIESTHLLCERITCYQRDYEELQQVDDLLQMQSIVDKKINQFLHHHPSLTADQLSGGRLCKLQRLLNGLNQDKITFSDYVLPGPNVPYSSPGTRYMWDYYSMDQKEKRIALFFYFHELSYLDMVERNFPMLARYFKRYSDAPYQVIVEIDHHEDSDSHDCFSEPDLLYYHIASSTPNVPIPIITRIKNGQFTPDNQLFQNIRDSYSQQGRVARHVWITRTGFTFTTISRRLGTYDPLSDYVYRSIKDSLKDVFGSS